MKITALSDTHSLHDTIKINPTNILIHAGDITEYGTKEEVEDFLYWFSLQPAEVKIFIGGNHDLYLDKERKEFRKSLKKYHSKNIIYLFNESYRTAVLHIWGSPLCMPTLGMAFNSDDRKRNKLWNSIPDSVNIIITHTPPLLEKEVNNGCSLLSERIKLIKPKFHIFGHHHAGYGITNSLYTSFVNAALASENDYLVSDLPRLVNKPIELVV